MKKTNYPTKESKEELASTATLVGAGIGLAYLLNKPFYEALRETFYNARHARRTVGEMIHGTEGERGVVSLLEENADSQTRAEYAAQIAGLVKMREIYRENETISREAERLIAQLGGTLAQGTRAGDEAANISTGGFSRKIDDFIINIFASVEDARTNLPKINEVYKEFRKFYDGREKSEKTVGEFCKYLESRSLEAVAENKRIERDLDNLITQVDKTYVVEDKVFAIDDKINVLKYLIGKSNEEKLVREEIEGLEKSVQDYEEGVNETRTSIEQHTGIPAYQNPTAWIDYSVNPIVIGIAGGLLAKGAIDLVSLIAGVRKPVRNLLALPFNLAYAGAREAGKLSCKGIRAAKKFAQNKLSKRKNANKPAERTATDEEEKELNSLDYQI